jgi:hypothetical protein
MAWPAVPWLAIVSGMATPRKITFDTVRELGLTLGGVEEGTVYGSPALKVRGKMFACIAMHRSAEPLTLALRVGFFQRDDLIARDPDTFYLKAHYLDYPVVLVRLARVRRAALRELLAMAWRFVSKERPRPRPR